MKPIPPNAPKERTQGKSGSSLRRWVVIHKSAAICIPHDAKSADTALSKAQTGTSERNRIRFRQSTEEVLKVEDLLEKALTKSGL
jgi:hypothetical protein